jgi:crotonobetainyl-CoA:carnitine CoA-transferase CaiB-like acyl-CoA transferase
MTFAELNLLQTLDDVDVVVVGSSLVGSFLGRVLEDQGASVTFVRWGSHDVEADVASGGLALKYALDMDDDGADIKFNEMVSRADLLVDALCDESLARSGRDFDYLVSLQPRLLYCVIRPFPKIAGEQMCTSEWRMAAALGFDRLDRNEKPQVLPIPLAGGFGALYGAVNIAIALLEQQRTGHPKKFEMSVFGASLMALTFTLMQLPDEGSKESKGPFRSAGDLRYLCADGKTVQITTNVPSVVASLFQVIDKPSWYQEALDDLISEVDGRSEEVWRERLQGVFIQKPAMEWERLISQAGGACAVCRTSIEWLAEPHAQDSGVIIRTQDAGSDQSFRAGPVVCTYAAGTEGRRSGKRRKHPRINTPADHDQAIIPLPLSGKKVIELAVILAGPSAGRVLGEFGADVIKIDSPHRASPPYTSQKGWLDVNRTKRSVLIDLRTRSGCEVAWDLIEGADVVIQSYRTHKIADLGFGPREVFARNPNAVYVSLNAYDYGGELSNRPGWEPLAQAVTGIHLEPNSDDLPPRIPLPINDFGSGLACAYGAVLGIREMERSGRGVHVMASLARTATFFMQTELGIAADASPRYLGDREVRLLCCLGGWIATSGERGLVNRVIERVPDLLEQVAKFDFDGASQFLLNFGIETAIVRTPADLSGKEWLRSCGLISSWDHPHWGTIEHSFPEAAVVGIGHRQGWPAYDPGENTVEVLLEAGFLPAEIDEMINDASVRGRVPLF